MALSISFVRAHSCMMICNDEDILGWGERPIRTVDNATFHRDLTSGNLTWLLKIAIDIVTFPSKGGDFP